MSKDANAASICIAARILLDADRPLSMDEVFPAYLEKAYGIKMNRQIIRRAIRVMMDRDEVIEVKDGNSIRFRINPDKSFALREFAAPPEALSEQEVETMRRGMTYHKNTEEIRARVFIALRALKRLAAAPNGMSRNTIFIAQKGNKFQERAVWNNGWQIPFLEELEARKVIVADEAEGIKLYIAQDRDFLVKVAEWKGEVCVYTLLWPDNPCTVDHSKPENAEVHKAHKVQSDSDDEPEQESDGEVITSAPTLEPPKPRPTREDYEKDRILLILDAQAQMIKVLDRLSYDIAQLVARTEEIATSNEANNQARIHLSKEVGKLSKELSHIDSSLSSSVGKLQTKVDNLDQSIAGVKKSVESHVSVVREVAADIAAAMASSSSKVIGEVNRLREDYKFQVKVPAIMSRISSFQEELTKLKSLLPSKHS